MSFVPDTQNKEFQDALNLIQYTRQSVFLTGKAGTGKSTFLRYICEHTKKKHVVLAPTGIAAINAGGSTLHSFFKLPFYPLLPDNPDFSYGADDLIDFFSRNRADTIMLINPDNPSGNFIPKADVLRLAGWCADNGVRLVVDESFVDFSEGWRDNSLLHDDILEAYPTMAVMKSISKSYGVPGIRLGILCSADEALIARIKKMVSIWNINSFAEYFMQIFTKYEKDYFRACDKFIAERNDFEKRLREIPFLRVIPSQANYFLCEVKAPLTAREIVIDTLRRHDILLRDCSDKGGLNGGQFLRIAVRDHADNSRLIEALKQFGK